MRVLSFSILVLLMISCKKNRNCACKTVINYAGGSESFVSSAKPLEKRLTEKQAKAVCDREATAIDATYNNFLTNNNSWSSNGLYAHSTCKLE